MSRTSDRKIISVNLLPETIEALCALATEERGYTTIAREILEAATETGHASPAHARAAALGAARVRTAIRGRARAAARRREGDSNPRSASDLHRKARAARRPR